MSVPWSWAKNHSPHKVTVNEYVAMNLSPSSIMGQNYEEHQSQHSSASTKTSIMLTNSSNNYNIEPYVGKDNQSILKKRLFGASFPCSQRHFYSGAVRMIWLMTTIIAVCSSKYRVFHCASYILSPRKFNPQWEITNMLILGTAAGNK